MLFKNLGEYESFKEKLDELGMDEVREHHIVEEIKREEADMWNISEKTEN